MTWEELKEKAKELGYTLNKSTVWNGRYYYEGETLSLEGITFAKEGVMFIDGAGIVAYDRKPEQMLMVMDALK